MFIYRVRTDPGKVWKVLEFNVEIFKALKSLENDHRYGKVWKNQKTVMLTWKMQMSIALLITDAFVNFLAIHNTKHLKFKVQKFESHSVYGIEGYIIHEISAFESQFCNVFVHIKMNKMP